MKSNTPKKHNAHPQHKKQQPKPNATTGNKAGRKKKSPCKDNRPLAYMYATYQVQNPRTKSMNTVFLALCENGQKPWNNLNFGEKVDKHSFRHEIMNMPSLD